MDWLWRDLRYALRSLARQPGFAVVAIVTLALGIGANTAVFSLFDQVILRPLPVEQPERLVIIEVDGPQPQGWTWSDNRHSVFSPTVFAGLAERSEVFESVIARTAAAVAFADSDGSERAAGELVSGGFFDALGVRPALGRLLTAQDDRRPEAHPVVVLSHGFWQRRFGESPGVLNRTIRLNGHPMTVIGVAAAGFDGVMSGRSPDVYMPLAMRREMKPAMFGQGVSEAGLRTLNLLARLKPGVTIEQAEPAAQAAYQSVLAGVIADTEAAFGTTPRERREAMAGARVHLEPASQGIHAVRDSSGEPLLWLTGMVVVVLLITCVNVAGLLVARALGRSKEIAVRLALGSGRGDLLRQLLIESLLLAFLGSLAGLLAASWILNPLIQLAAGENGLLRATLNSRVLVFNFALATLTGLVFGLAPAWHAVRTAVVESLRAHGAAAQERHGVRFRQAAVVVQVSLSVMLLVAAGLLARSLYNLKNLDPGFHTRHVLSFTVDPVLSGYDRARGMALYEQLLHRFRQLPGATIAGAADSAFLGDSDRTGRWTVAGYRGSERGGHLNAVSTDLFRTLGISILAGRAFHADDVYGRPKVAVVNEAFVRTFSPGGSPIGMRMAKSAGAGSLDIEIVGVARDTRSLGLRSPAQPFVYTPLLQEENLPWLTFYLRADQDEEALGPEVRRVVHELDATLPVYDMRTIRQTTDLAMSNERALATLSVAFALLATLLAGLGLYGLLAYAVARRTREIGLRLALGASRKIVVAMVVRQALRYVLVGIAIGLPAALAVVRYLESQLFGLTPHDPWVLTAAVAVLAMASLIAAFLPARRAARVEPIEALRYE